MTFIDWSDSHEMLGLLAEFVADERAESANDPDRRRFLASLSGKLAALTERIEEVSDAELIAALRTVQNSVEGAFRGDPVMEHIEACIGELQRIAGR